MSEKRLEELLDKKDEELEELRSKLYKAEELERVLQYERESGWTRHEMLPKDDYRLPLPRLELRWYDAQEGNTVKWCQYALVRGVKYGKEVIRVPLGETRSTCMQGFKIVLDKPLENGRQMEVSMVNIIAHDIGHLKIPGYVVYGNNVQMVCFDENNHVVYGPLFHPLDE